jgi:hypothetical protein
MARVRVSPENAKTFLHISVAVIPLIIGGVCLYYDKQGVDATHLFVYGAIIPIAVYLTVLSELAIVLFFKQLHEQDVVHLETFSDASLFAKRRAAIVSSIEPESVKYNIISTSHCNLFARPDGETLKEMESVARVNRELFEAMVRIALNPNSEGRIRVLFSAESQQELNDELNERHAILNAVALELKRQWDADHFRVEMLAGRSLKDYLIIEDHVFKTIRKVKTNRTQGNQAKYIHIQSKKIADSYREWLRDMFENDQSGRYVRRTDRR